MRTPAVLVMAALTLAACAETVDCPDGEGYPPLPGGGHGSECVPLPDGGLDGGEQTDPDAGPCGGCFGGTLCRVDDGQCVSCLSDDDCGTDAPFCDTEAGECASCLTDSECANPTPVCREGSCGGCTAHTDCAAQDDAPSCDTSSGNCVQCTVDTEETACPAPDNRACHPTDFTCTGAPRGTLGFCQPCVSDNECMTNTSGTSRCVPMQFKGAPHGSYCLLDLESYRTAIDDPAAPCPDTMTTSRTERSVFGVEATYCFVSETITTCEAVLGFRDLCPGGDADCGVPGLDDASCQAGTCTYECSGARDCSTGLCVGGGPSYCQ